MSGRKRLTVFVDVGRRPAQRSAAAPAQSTAQSDSDNCPTPPAETPGQSCAVNPANLIRFSTQYADEVTGDLKYLFREYRPSVGRWMNRDQIGEEGDVNLNRFARNDCINLVDIFGHFGGPVADSLAKQCQAIEAKKCADKGGVYMSLAEAQYGGSLYKCAEAIATSTLPGAICLGLGMTAGGILGVAAGGPTVAGNVAGGTAGAAVGGGVVSGIYAIICNTKKCYYPKK